MTRGHPNCYTYRYDFFKKVIEAIFKIDNEQVLQNVLAIHMSKMNEKDYNKFAKKLMGQQKPGDKKPVVDHKQQLKNIGKI